MGTDQNPEDSSKIVFAEQLLRLANNSSFLRIDQTENSGKLRNQEKYFLSSLGLDYEYLRVSGNLFLLGNTLKNCPRQFAQLHS